MASPRPGHALQSGVQIAAATAGNLAVMAIAARGLGPDGMGNYGILLFAQQIAVLLASAGWGAAATKYMAAADAAGDRAALRAAFGLAGRRVAAGSATLAALGLASAIAAGDPWRAAAGPLAAGIPAQAAYTLLTAACQALGGFKATALGSTLAMPLLVMAAWWAVTAGLGIPGLLGALALSSGLQCLVLGWWLWSRLGATASTLPRETEPHRMAGQSAGSLPPGRPVAAPSPVEPPLALPPFPARPGEGRPAASRSGESLGSGGQAVHPSAPGTIPAREHSRYARACLTMSLLDAIVWQRSELFFLGYFSTPAAAGQYHIAHGLAGTAMKAVPGALIPLLVPAMARARSPDELAMTYRSATRWMAILAIPVATGVCLVSGSLVALLCGPGYGGVAPLLSALAVCNAAVMVLGYPASSVLYAAGGERVIARVGMAVAALNLMLALALIPPLGAPGAALANALAQLASLGPGMALAFARMPGRPHLPDIARPLAASALMIVPVQAIVQTLPTLPGLVAAVMAGAATYGAALVGLGGIRRTELRRMMKFG